MKNLLIDIGLRFKSPVTWTALGAFLLWILKTSGGLEPMGLTADSFNMGWNLFIGFLVTLGVINNPKDKVNF